MYATAQCTDKKGTMHDRKNCKLLVIERWLNNADRMVCCKHESAREQVNVNGELSFGACNTVAEAPFARDKAVAATLR